jgi:hypothetical protein
VQDPLTAWWIKDLLNPLQLDMTAIKATLDNGHLLLDHPLPKIAARLQALVVISDDDLPPQGLPAQKLAEEAFTAEEEFEAIGLRDFFHDPVDEGINWEKFFGVEK